MVHRLNKFGRNYFLQIQKDDGSILKVGLPLTVEFDITRNTLTSANVCQVRIYNLSAQHRNQIYFNAFNQSEYRSIVLQAGYGSDISQLPIIFTGNITSSWSVREGVNYISQIECYDGGFTVVNSDVNATFVSGTDLTTVLRGIMSLLPNLKSGSIGNFIGRSLPRTNTFAGNAVKILNELSGGGFFIDKGIGNVLSTDAYIPNEAGVITIINNQSGILNTPLIEGTVTRFDILFEPTLNVGNLVSLESTTNPQFNSLNRIYKITSVKHRGMISAAVCGSVVTTGEFFYSKDPEAATGPLTSV